MPFYKRGFLYLMRKRGKSVLLLLIFLFVNSMILSTNMILHATESTEAAMQEKAGAKVVCEISDTANPITDKEAEMIKNLAEVTSINRMGQQSAYLTDLAPVTASASTEPDNLKVSLLSFDDMDTDSPITDAFAYLFRRHGDCLPTALYVDAEQTKGNGCIYQLGRTESHYLFAGSFGSGSRVSHCPALLLRSRFAGCRKPYRTVAVFCGNRRFSAGFLTIYRYRIAIGDWQRSGCNCCIAVFAASNPCKSERYSVTNGGIIR